MTAAAMRPASGANLPATTPAALLSSPLCYYFPFSSTGAGVFTAALLLQASYCTAPASNAVALPPLLCCQKSSVLPQICTPTASKNLLPTPSSFQCYCHCHLATSLATSRRHSIRCCCHPCAGPQCCSSTYLLSAGLHLVVIHCCYCSDYLCCICCSSRATAPQAAVQPWFRQAGTWPSQLDASMQEHTAAELKLQSSTLKPSSIWLPAEAATAVQRWQQRRGHRAVALMQHLTYGAAISLS